MVTLSYPYPTPSVILVLPSPILGNSRQLEEPFNIDWSATGRVYTYRKATGTQKLLMTFEKLSFTQFANLKLFLYQAVNNMAGYLDSRNRQWKGVFLNNPFEKSQDSKSFASITLEFRGIKI
jgi:hypothetical protein